MDNLSVFKRTCSPFEAEENTSAHELSIFLLENYSILIKDLSKKINAPSRQFIRIAVKDENDDNELINAMYEYYKI